jgi:hypothetical protein
MGKVAWSNVVVTAEARIAVIVASAEPEAQVDRKASAHNWSTVAIETNECWAAEADPTAVPSMVCADKQARSVYDSISPTVGRRSLDNVTWPGRICCVVIPHLGALVNVVADADDLVRAIHSQVEARMIVANVIALLVKRTQATFALSGEIVKRRAKLGRLCIDVPAV